MKQVWTVILQDTCLNRNEFNKEECLKASVNGNKCNLCLRLRKIGFVSCVHHSYRVPGYTSGLCCQRSVVYFGIFCVSVELGCYPVLLVRCMTSNQFDFMQTDWTSICHCQPFWQIKNSLHQQNVPMALYPTCITLVISKTPTSTYSILQCHIQHTRYLWSIAFWRPTTFAIPMRPLVQSYPCQRL